MRKRLISGILCMALVISMSSFTAYAEEDFFVFGSEEMSAEESYPEEPAGTDELFEEAFCIPEEADLSVQEPAGELQETSADPETEVFTDPGEEEPGEILPAGSGSYTGDPFVWWEGRQIAWQEVSDIRKGNEVDYYEIRVYYDSVSGPYPFHTLYYYPGTNKLYREKTELDTEKYLVTKQYGSGKMPDPKDEWIERLYYIDPFAIPGGSAAVINVNYYFYVDVYYKDGRDRYARSDKYEYPKDLEREGFKTFDGYLWPEENVAYVGVDFSFTWQLSSYDFSAVHTKYQVSDNRYGPWTDITGTEKTGQDGLKGRADFDVLPGLEGKYIRFYLWVDGYENSMDSGAYQVFKGVPLDNEFFPDNQFRSVLQPFDTNVPLGFLDLQEVKSITSLDASGKGMTGVKGIEYLPYLEEADFSNNHIVIADFGHKPYLKKLDLSGNDLLDSLNISGCEALEELFLNDTAGIGIADLDISGCQNLKTIDLLNSCFRTLDLRQHPFLRDTVLYGKQEISGNSSTYTYETKVKDPVSGAYAAKTGTVLINDVPGSGTTVLIADFDEISFPCPEFRKMAQKLVNDTSHTPGILELSESQSLSDIDFGDADPYAVTSLKGLEYFSRLERLMSGEEWNITHMDLHPNQELTYLDLSGNRNLNYVNLKNNIGLETLWLRNTGLQTIDLSGNYRLKEAHLGECGQLQTITLKTDSASQLKILEAARCDLQGTLDLTNQPLLEELECQGNRLKKLKLPAGQNLTKLYCYDNDLNIIDISQSPCLLEAYEKGDGTEKTDRFGMTYLDYSYNGYELFISPATRIRTEPEEMRISLNRYSAELATTKTLQLKATITPEEEADLPITWTSDDTDIATVSSTGLVKAKKYGKVKITASAGGKSAVCTIQTRFKDVNNKGKSYYEAVYWAVNAGITKCTVTFRPDDGVKRGEFTAFLYRFAGKFGTPPATTKITTKFTDVNKDTQFAKEISWAVEQGIITGFSDHTFRPNDTLTRVQCAIMIWRYAGKPKPKSVCPFPDVTAAATSDTYKAVTWGAENDIIRGSGGKFGPADPCTRANVVTFLYRYYEKFC